MRTFYRMKYKPNHVSNLAAKQILVIEHVKYAVPGKFAGAYFKVESNPGFGKVDFAALQSRLKHAVIRRIYNGEFTERGFARMLGISQPQVHNVLKGARKL